MSLSVIFVLSFCVCVCVCACWFTYFTTFYLHKNILRWTHKKIQIHTLDKCRRNLWKSSSTHFTINKQNQLKKTNILFLFFSYDDIVFYINVYGKLKFFHAFHEVLLVFFKLKFFFRNWNVFWNRNMLCKRSCNNCVFSNVFADKNLMKMLMHIFNKNMVALLYIFAWTFLNSNSANMLVCIPHENMVSLQYVFACIILDWI